LLGIDTIGVVMIPVGGAVSKITAGSVGMTGATVSYKFGTVGEEVGSLLGIDTIGVVMIPVGGAVSKSGLWGIQHHQDLELEHA